jgi:hypothetical protein
MYGTIKRGSTCISVASFALSHCRICYTLLLQAFFQETSLGNTMKLLLRRTLPLKEQYPATKARRHKECFWVARCKFTSAFICLCVAGFMGDCTATGFLAPPSEGLGRLLQRVTHLRFTTGSNMADDHGCMFTRVFDE